MGKTNIKQTIIYLAVGVLGILLIVSVFIGDRSDADGEESKQQKKSKNETYQYKDPESKSDNHDNEENSSNNDDSLDDDKDMLNDIDIPDMDDEDIGYDEEYIEKNYDFEGDIQDRVGKREHKKIMKRAEQAMQYFIQGNTSGWDKFATEKMTKSIKAGDFELLDKEEKLTYEIYPTEQTHDEDIIIGATVSTENNGEALAVSMIFTEIKDGYFLENIVPVWEYDE